MALETRERPPFVLPRSTTRTPKWRPEPSKLREAWQRVLPEKMLPTLLDPACFWMLYGSFEDRPIVLSEWEVAHLHDYSLLRARVKAPQIGFSLTCAMEAVWECLVYEDAYTVFVSVDQREASEKVLYARKLYDGLPEVFKEVVPLAKDSFDALWFGSATRPSRVESIPATAALRGRRGSVVLDEAEFMLGGGEPVFRVAVGRISLGGRVTVGSSVFGSGTLLDRITGERMSDDAEDELEDIRTKFSVAILPWSVVEDPEQLRRIALAEATLDEYDFAEEYECVRGGRGSDTFDADLLRRRTHEEPIAAEVDSHIVFDDEEVIAGFDVGEVADPSVLSAFSHRGESWYQSMIYLPRGETAKVMPLPDQETMLIELLTAHPKLTLVIDARGIGASAAEKLRRRFGRRVIPFKADSKPAGFPSMDRYNACVELKSLLESGRMWLMPDRAQYQEFRRTRLVAGKVQQKGGPRDSHFDVFWASAMAGYGITMGRKRVQVPSSLGVVRVG